MCLEQIDHFSTGAQNKLWKTQQIASPIPWSVHLLTNHHYEMPPPNTKETPQSSSQWKTNFIQGMLKCITKGFASKGQYLYHNKIFRGFQLTFPC